MIKPNAKENELAILWPDVPLRGKFLFCGNFLVNWTAYVEFPTAAWQCQLHCLLQPRDNFTMGM